MIGTIFNAQEYSLKPKATIQQSGKLGFNGDAIKQLKISEDNGIIIAQDSNDKKLFYMALTSNQNETAFPVRKSGLYFYINSKQLFDKLELDYTQKTYIFDLVRCNKFDQEIGGECYKMIMRENPRTQEDKEE